MWRAGANEQRSEPGAAPRQSPLVTRQAAGATNGAQSWESRRPSAAISSRYACSLARSSGRDEARIATASRPAFAAPDGPMATVATGTPFGIWTVDSRESRPFKALTIGTQITGRTVWAATAPARWAAPPAPAIITSRPRLAAVAAASAVSAGVR